MPFKKGETPKGAKPFKKGQSGNPNGRPCKLPDLDVLMAEVLSDEEEGKTAALRILNELRREALKGKGTTKLRAAEMLLDRGYGRPKQPNEFTGKDGEPIQVEQTLIQIAFRPPQEAEPTASKKPTAPKGERKKG